MLLTCLADLFWSAVGWYMSRRGGRLFDSILSSHLLVLYATYAGLKKDNRQESSYRRKQGPNGLTFEKRRLFGRKRGSN